jgi:hypothetical protein
VEAVVVRRRRFTRAEQSREGGVGERQRDDEDDRREEQAVEPPNGPSVYASISRATCVVSPLRRGRNTTSGMVSTTTTVATRNARPNTSSAGFPPISTGIAVPTVSGA